MVIYLFIWSLIIAGYFVASKKTQNFDNRYYIVLSAIMIAVVGFRADDMGYDTHNYRDYFLHPNSKNTFYQYYDIEIGVSIINWIIRFIWNDVYFSSVVKATIAMVPLFLFFYRVSPNKYLSVFLFASFSIGTSLYLIEFAAERQMLALGFFAISQTLYHDNKYKLSIGQGIALTCMVFCHSSSLMVLPLYLLTQLKNNKILILIITALSILSGYLLEDYAQIIYLIADNYEKGFYLSNYGNVDNSIISLIPYYGTFLIALYYWPKEKLNNIWFLGLFMAVVFTGFLQTIGINIERMLAYFYLCSFVAIPKAINCIKDKWVKYVFVSMLLGYFSYKFFYVLEISAQLERGMVPYKSFLFDVL